MLSYLARLQLAVPLLVVPIAAMAGVVSFLVGSREMAVIFGAASIFGVLNHLMARAWLRASEARNDPPQ